MDAAFEPSWLCPTPMERRRLLELDALLGASKPLIPQLLPLSVVVAAFWAGPWALLPAAVAGPAFGVVEKLLPRVHKPEWPLMAALLSFMTSLSVAIGLTGGLRSPLTFWVIFYMVGVAARFGPRGVALATAWGAVASLAAVVAGDPAHFTGELPALVTVWSVSIVAGRYTRVLARAEFGHRAAALLDPLTGLPNRSALADRFEELRRQAERDDAPLALVVLDLDHFKRVNDEHGHDRGDAVLKDVADALRGAIRTFDPIYRVGGEEFVLLLPGADLAAGREVAQRLRRAIAARRPGGLRVTASLGVAAARGAEIEFDALFRAADQALYSAKAAGRDRVAAGHLVAVG
jgi:diguanylate cyclase (GGDEF)-like protein